MTKASLRPLDLSSRPAKAKTSAMLVGAINLAFSACGPVFLATSSYRDSTMDLYVAPTGSDSNPGTDIAPLRSIPAASRAARPGYTIHFAPGIYIGGATTTNSGTSAEPIRYVSDVKWGAKIVPAADSTFDAAWSNGGANVSIDGFEVDGTNYRGGIPWRIGIYTTGSNSILKNNHVHNLAFNALCTNRGGVGIEGDSYYGGTDIDLVGNIVHDIGMRRCLYIHGIYQTAPGRVANNLVYRVAGFGIHLWHDANHITVVNNTVFNSAYGGLLVGGGDYINTTGPADYITVANNIVFDNKGYGIIETGQTGSHNLFTHNLSYRNGTNWRLRTSAADPAPVTADPKFVDYLPNGGGDYRLAPGSPAIDAGTPAYASPTDLGGVSRPQGDGYDIGAYEFVSPSPSSAQRMRANKRRDSCR